MHFVSHAPIRTKLTAVLVCICIVFAVVCMAFVFFGVSMMKRQLRLQQSALADTVGANAATSLLVDDRQLANEVLSSLHLVPAVHYAAVFESDGSVFAAYGMPPSVASIPPPNVDPSETTYDWMIVSKPIHHNGKPVGTIVLYSSMSALRRQLTGYASVVVAILIVAFLLSFVMSRFLQRTIAQPITDLVQSMRRVSEEGDFSRRVAKVSSDDIGTLCDGVNEMLAQVEKRDKHLSELHRKLTATARKADQAEVATNVLHNVGNVLNSMNIGTAKLQELLQDSRIWGLEKLLVLLNEHKDDLPAFFAHDERARRLPNYLAKLVNQLHNEQKTALSHLELVVDAVSHVKQIVQAQQSFAVGVKFAEACDLIELMEEALLLTGLSCERHGIEVRRDYAQLPPAKVEKGKLLQVLVNIISNAKDALKASSHNERLLMLSLRDCDGEVVIEVADNGIGIEPCDLTRIFAHGFTTKPNGHGFGLHSAANAMTEIGGSLAAASDGAGNGARFVVRLPPALVTAEAC